VKNKNNDYLLKKLEKRIEETEKKVVDLTKKNIPSSAKEYSTGMRTLFELIVGFVFGGLVGYYCDIWFNSSPFILLVGIFLGGISGIYTIWRRNELNERK
jgi:F0F1-type ATP synthase assembly protein I